MRPEGQHCCVYETHTGTAMRVVAAVPADAGIEVGITSHIDNKNL
jgi:hypothetical protein